MLITITLTDAQIAEIYAQLFQRKAVTTTLVTAHKKKHKKYRPAKVLTYPRNPTQVSVRKFVDKLAVGASFKACDLIEFVAKDLKMNPSTGTLYAGLEHEMASPLHCVLKTSRGKYERIK